jgi:hypothetical protein
VSSTDADWDALDPAVLDTMFAQLHLIRAFEEEVLVLAGQRLINGPAHSSLGQEGGAVGSALRGAREWVTDPVSPTLNGMLDIEKLDWSDQIVDRCGVGRDRPPVGIPTGQGGVVWAAISYATGIPEAMALCRGAGDQQAPPER